MKRIMVIGVSAGVGKSTFARKLGENLSLPVYHLDAYFWKPGWIQAPLEEFRNAQKKMVEEDQWIIEGNYTSTYDIRAEKADTIIYLELPLYVCLYRVVTRWLKNIGRTRPDMAEGCKEKIDWEFIKFIITTYYPRKKNINNNFKAFQLIGGRKTIITLKNKKELNEYLHRISSKTFVE
ncbi:topology modulation protein [Heyndrickxia sp. NPDC080065]|uniref:topology modulation protein n=1 Tax=Heyndrickxia sp. NPDC080065 TaxID=3390568 RepID=UPI003D014DC6